MANPPRILQKKVLNSLSGTGNMIETAIIQERVSDEFKNKLLKHPDPEISFSTAMGIWRNIQRYQKDNKFSNECKRVFKDIDIEVFSHANWRHDFKKILLANHDIAFEWIRNSFQQFKEKHIQFDYWIKELFVNAVQTLTKEERFTIIDEMPSTGYLEGFAMALVNDDIDLYRKILENKILSRSHLAPLAKTPSGDWADMAKLAIQEGYSPTDISMAIITGPTGVFDPSVESWDKRIEVFKDLNFHNDPQIQKIGKKGLEYSIKNREKKIRNIKSENIFGY